MASTDDDMLGLEAKVFDGMALGMERLMVRSPWR